MRRVLIVVAMFAVVAVVAAAPADARRHRPPPTTTTRPRPTTTTRLPVTTTLAPTTTTETTMPAYISGAPLINVVTYGATGNGSTNDTTAVQAAATAAAGKTLYFPEGTYRVSQVNIPANTKVTGHGPTSILKPITLGSTRSDAVFNVANNVTISNLKIDGNGTTNIPSDWSDAYNNYPVAGNNFKDSDLVAPGSGKGRGFRAAIRGEAITGLTVTGVEFTALAGAAIGLNNSSQVTVTNNYLHDSAWELVYAMGATSPTFVAIAGQNYVISGNTITNVHAPAGANALGINPDSIVLSRISGFNVSYNTLTGIDRDFLKLEACKNGIVASNTASAPNTAIMYAGMQISPMFGHHDITSENIRVAYNTFTGPGWVNGIQVNSDDTLTQVTKNIEVDHNTVVAGAGGVGVSITNGIVFDGNTGLYQINIHDNDLNGTTNLCLNGYEGGGTGLILNNNRNDGVTISPNVSVPGAFAIHTYIYN